MNLRYLPTTANFRARGVSNDRQRGGTSYRSLLFDEMRDVT